MKHISLSSTSFLIPSNDHWKLLKENFKITYQDYGKIITTKEKINFFSEINIIFLADLIDFFELNPKNFNKNKKILDKIIKLFNKRLQSTSSKIIIGVSEYLSDNNITFSRQKKLSEQLKIYFLNKLYDLIKKNKNLFVLNLDNSFSKVGYNNCFSSRNFYLMNSRLSEFGLNVLVIELSSLMQRLVKTNSKVLIVDCDNTLWGGVIAEDGIKKIQIGQDGIGRAFRDFQKAIKNLKNSGILIALASKNEKKDVLDVIKNHKSMILKDDDVTSYKINWKEKTQNIIELSEELMLGLDSFVFWDDNPVEREKVKKNLKKVNVIEPHQDVSEWPKQISEYIGFLKFTNTKEDYLKTSQYKKRDKFLLSKKKYNNDLEYLKTIKLKINVNDLNNSNIDRAVQLTQKTNQFNFTTKRYDHKTIKEFTKNKKNSFLVNIKDIYGDHGLVALVLLKELNNYLVIDTFLLSCRILGRYIENWILGYIQKSAIKRKLNGTIIQFNKTEKNIPAMNFLSTIKIDKYSKKLDSESLYKILNIKSNRTELFILKNNKKITMANIYD